MSSLLILKQQLEDFQGLIKFVLEHVRESFSAIQRYTAGGRQKKLQENLKKFYAVRDFSCSKLQNNVKQLQLLSKDCNTLFFTIWIYCEYGNHLSQAIVGKRDLDSWVNKPSWNFNEQTKELGITLDLSKDDKNCKGPCAQEFLSLEESKLFMNLTILKEQTQTLLTYVKRKIEEINFIKANVKPQNAQCTQYLSFVVNQLSCTTETFCQNFLEKTYPALLENFDEKINNVIQLNADECEMGHVTVSKSNTG